MRKTVIALGVFCFLVALNNTFAQISENRNALTYKFLISDYNGPLTDSYFDTDNFTYGGEMKYTRFLNRSFNLGIPLRLGRVEYPSSDSLSSPTESLFASGDLTIIYKLNNGYLFKETSIIAPYLFAGIGGNYVFDLDDSNFDAQVPAGLGFDIKLAKNVRLQLQSEYRYSLVNEFNNLRHTAGLKFMFGGGNKIKKEEEEEVSADTDGDGIDDVTDKCPDKAGLAKFSGCPDTDSDGIQDSNDECPDVAGVARFKGCPDSDGDGIADKDDKCPDKAGTRALNGCPAVDTDRDGINDDKDKCPEKRGLTRFDGCPDSDGDGTPDPDDKCPATIGSKDAGGCPDTDKDGITDKEDKCPTTPGIAEKDGCPEEPVNNTVIITNPGPTVTLPANPISTTTTITTEVQEVMDYAMRSVRFETGSSTLKTSSYTVLDQVADVLLTNGIYSLSIEGHTDALGDDKRNMKLSESRAKACFDYLVKKGIDESRMSYIGYGEERPIGDNNRTKGREKNRRVEFNIFLR